ncbi:MAG: 4a-hydroxytetrahydrobiopterin dehydratase [Microthrixaceae bacterium]|nr:4a-hydroxytetrahydrobiopterin dehydratase [Microthrixaceae bacterium]
MAPPYRSMVTDSAPAPRHDGTVTAETVTPDGWQRDSGALVRRFEFVDFASAFAFMTVVAALAEELDHHPDWCNSYNVVTIELRSHDVGAITERDVRLAARINGLLGGVDAGLALDGLVEGDGMP